MEEGLTIQIKTLLDQVSFECQEAADEAGAEVARECVRKLKQTSPKDTGDYAKGWAVKNNGDHELVVYNRTKPGLTHLLNNGHDLVNGGRYAGDGHITKVNEWAEQEYVEKVNRILGVTL